MWDFSPWPGTEPASPVLEAQRLTTVPPGSPWWITFKGLQYFVWHESLYDVNNPQSDPGDSCYYPVLTDLAKEAWGFKPTAALISFKLEVKIYNLGQKTLENILHLNFREQ